MKIIPLILLFAACLFSAGCFSGSPQGIEEISLGGGSRDYKGDGHFSEVKFRKDGLAEINGKTFVHDVTVTEQFHKRGKISPEQFENLSRVLTDKNFFSKENRGTVMDASDTLKVVYSKGVKELQMLGRDDPDSTAIMDAILQTNQQIKWENVE